MREGECGSDDEELPEFVCVPRRKNRVNPPPPEGASAEEKLIHLVSVLDDLANKFGLQEAMRGKSGGPQSKCSKTTLKEDGETPAYKLYATPADLHPEPKRSDPLRTVDGWQVISVISYFTMVVALLSLINVFSTEMAICLILAMICYALVDTGNIFICNTLIKLCYTCFERKNIVNL